MSGRTARRRRGLSLATLSLAGCMSGSYGVRSHYQSPEPVAEPGPAVRLLSAHLTRYGDKPAPLHEAAGERLVEGGEHTQDSLLLVFGEELDPLTLSPLAFAILRADGRRVRPTRAVLAPADEGDENRSVTLLGNFSSLAAPGSEPAPPVAVHLIGSIYAESGASLEDLDADITPPSEPDRPVLVERLAPGEDRCPGAAQVLRSYWTDALVEVGAEDLAGIELRLADGRVVHPIEFDDQARRTEDPPCPEPFAACLGPADDNVLDLCVAVGEPIVALRFAAGLFSDADGHRSAVAEVSLAPALPPAK